MNKVTLGYTQKQASSISLAQTSFMSKDAFKSIWKLSIIFEEQLILMT